MFLCSISTSLTRKNETRNAIQPFIYIMIQYTGWNLDGLFMASALRGLSGSMTAFLAGATFFAINSVNSEMRSTRLGIQEFLNGIAYAIANIMVGYWVKSICPR
jgi:hypothetical protein